MEAASTVYDLLSIPSHQCFFLTDIKYGYWAINVHPDDRHYLAFYILGIGQVQPIYMLQRARTSSFIFNELINIILGPIPALHSKLSLFYRKTAEDTASLVFYMDNIFGVFKIYKKQRIFLRDHFFLCMVWSKLKLMLSKLKIGMTKIFALREEHEIDRRVRLKLNKIKKILT